MHSWMWTLLSDGTLNTESIKRIELRKKLKEHWKYLIEIAYLNVNQGRVERKKQEKRVSLNLHPKISSICCLPATDCSVVSSWRVQYVYKTVCVVLLSEINFLTKCFSHNAHKTHRAHVIVFIAKPVFMHTHMKRKKCIWRFQLIIYLSSQ